jgi:GNAT superfamily N-acetyltransferase
LSDKRRRAAEEIRARDGKLKRMDIQVSRVDVQAILPLRELYRHEMHAQIVHDSFPRRGFSDAYLVEAAGRAAGYGLVSNQHFPDAVGEFYVIPAYRGQALPMFRRLLDVSRAVSIRAQSNDRLLSALLYDVASTITADIVLFADAFVSHLPCPDGVLRQTPESDGVDWRIEIGDTSVATGGVLFHYNVPYGDVYMNVEEPFRRRGFGSYLVQELKRLCYETGHVPAARCNAVNLPSRKTLEKAGLLPCGHILQGEVASRD